MEVCIVGATGGVGQRLVRAVLASEELSLQSAVAKRAEGQDVGTPSGMVRAVSWSWRTPG